MNTSSSDQNLYFGASSKLAPPVTHSALDFFERPFVLINYEGYFDQEVFPHVVCRGPQLDFFVTSDYKNSIDLNRIGWGNARKIIQPRLKSCCNARQCTFFNITLHSFSHVEIFLNGSLISSSNNNYHHDAFVETGLTTDPNSKRTWTVCQGYRYRHNKEKNLQV